MPALTPNMFLPYPLATDTVATVDDSIKALADKLDGPADNTAGATGSGWTGTATYYYRSGLVVVVMNFGKASWAGAETMMTLPVGFRPVVGSYLQGIGLNSGASVSVLIETTGAIKSVTAGTSGGILGAVTFVAAP